MLGTMYIHCSGGSAYTLENVAHDKFMSIKSDLDFNKGILLVKPDSHVYLNPQHVISVEWWFKK